MRLAPSVPQLQTRHRELHPELPAVVQRRARAAAAAMPDLRVPMPWQGGVSSGEGACLCRSTWIHRHVCYTKGAFKVSTGVWPASMCMRYSRVKGSALQLLSSP